MPTKEVKHTNVPHATVGFEGLVFGSLSEVCGQILEHRPHQK